MDLESGDLWDLEVEEDWIWLMVLGRILLKRIKLDFFQGGEHVFFDSPRFWRICML